MLLRVVACILMGAASSVLLAEEGFDQPLTFGSDDHFPAARRTEPAVEIPTEARGGAGVEAMVRAEPVVDVGTNKAAAGETAPNEEPVELALARDPDAPASAWLDLRQTGSADSATQTAPEWVKTITMETAQENGAARTVFHIELARPSASYRQLLFRLFFDDTPGAQPEVIARDAAGEQISHSGALGAGIDLPSSESVVIPMASVAAIDVAVAGDGQSVRAAYLDWMKRDEGAQPVNEQDRHIVAESFGALPGLRADESDSEKFGTVAATLSPETVRVGGTADEAATFQFGVERQPLVALLTFEVDNPRIDTPPEVFVNGKNIGAVTLVMPDLADPAYRGEMQGLASDMHFRYTGWIRAQKIVPAGELKPGDNQLIIANAAGTDAAAVRATQMQLKYLWEKSDYVLRPVR